MGSDDELKSAWEIALEKLEAKGEAPSEKLTDEQKEEIAEIRRRFQAKIAEAEIGIQSDIKKAARSGDFEQVETLRKKLTAEKLRLQSEMNAKIEQARKAR